MKKASEHKSLKPLLHFESLDEMQDHGLLSAADLTPQERLQEMTALNFRLYGPPCPPTQKTLTVFVSQPGESVNDFYARINGNELNNNHG